MDSNNDIEENEFDPASTQTVIIRAAKDGYWAELEVECSWSPDGRSFTAKTLFYRALDNDRTSGNIKIALVSQVDTGWQTLNSDDGVQDGEWHPFVKSRSVEGNARSAVVHFYWMYDRDNVSDVKMTGQEIVQYLPPPHITIPADGDVVLPDLVVHGAGVNQAQVTIHQGGSGTTLSNPTGVSGTVWQTGLLNPLTAGKKVITAKQQLGGASSGWAPNVEVTVLTKPSITSPSPHSVTGSRPAFSGRGVTGAQIQIHRSHSGDVVPHLPIFVLLGQWGPLYLISELPSGRHGFTATQTLKGVTSDWATNLDITVFKPTITAPTTDQEMSFTVHGTGGLEGHKITVRFDLQDGSEIGEDTVGDGGVWSVNVQVPEAGSTSLVAEQTYQTATQTSAPQRFKIKPPKLVNIQVSYPSPGTVRFSGGGYKTATVDVHIRNNSTPQGSAVVSAGQWFFDWSGQPPGAYEFNILQKVPDGSNGWILSSWSDTVPVTIPVPVPTLTAQPGTDRKPVLFGSGDSWSGQPATVVEVNVSGPSAPSIAPVNVNGSNWSYTATVAWAPGTYQLKARQVFKGIPSEWTSPATLIIHTPLPTVNVTQNGLTPVFSGTCLNGAQVSLGFDGDNGTPHSATVTGTTWTFTRPTAFTPGAYTARVIQSVNDQPSTVISKAFTVVVLKPVITAPIDEDVDHNPIIRGTGGIAGAVMRVFDHVSDLQLGEDTPVAGNEWFVPLTDLSFGPHSVYVIQAYGDFPSEKSEWVSFTVILFPPVIAHPQPGDDKARSFVIDGYARKALGFDTAQVELWLEGQDTPLARVRARGSDGYWSFQAQLPVGDYVLRAKQFFADEPSDFSAAHDFTAVPAIPVIESPTLQQHVGATVTVSGFGYVGDWVEVAWSDATNTVLGRVQVQANRTWSIPLQPNRPAGEQRWVVQQECEGYRSGWSEAHPVQLLSQAPIFTAPEAGHWFVGAPLFEGTGDTGKTIELSYWFDTRQFVAQDCPITEGQWRACPTALLKAGPYWMKARQVGQDDSDWSDSPRIEVAGLEDVPGVGR